MEKHKWVTYGDGINHGSIDYDGAILQLEEEAYASGPPDDPHYEAMATDDEGNFYKIRWEIINPQAEDESESCDWDTFTIEQS
jgi:hypothetical protein